MANIETQTQQRLEEVKEHALSETSTFFSSRLTAANNSHEEVKSIYEQWADNYDPDHLNKEVQYNPPQVGIDQLLAIHGVDRDSSRILDIGAGTGLLGVKLREKGFTNIDAVDASPQMLLKAREKDIYKNIIVATLGPHRLPIKTDSYDVVIGVGCFGPGHMNSSCFEELFRITKPGGYLLITIREAHLAKAQLQDFESSIRRHHDNDRCKLVKRHVVPNFHAEHNGVVYLLQI